MHPLTTFLLALLVPGAPDGAPADAQVPLAEVSNAEDIPPCTCRIPR